MKKLLYTLAASICLASCSSPGYYGYEVPSDSKEIIETIAGIYAGSIKLNLVDNGALKICGNYCSNTDSKFIEEVLIDADENKDKKVSNKELGNLFFLPLFSITSFNFFYFYCLI
jgi:hypothetical protein